MQRVGGVAALVEAATFVFGFSLFATALSDYTTGDPDPSESVSFLLDHQATFYVWNLVILVVFGAVLVPLVLALHERLRQRTPFLAQTAAVFGVIWAVLVLAAGMIANLGIGTIDDLHESDPAAAEPVWSALDTVQNGLGGGNELVGGLWVLLVSVAGLRSRALPKGLASLGVIAGAAGIITIVPALEDVGAVFGLGLIGWFVWTGVTLLRSPAVPEAAAGTQGLAPTS